jgi:hypothetical protein
MSKYVQMNGALIYENKEAYESAVAVLTNGAWIDSNGNWLEESGASTDMKALNPQTLTIQFPYQSYLNLSQYNIQSKLTKGCVLGVKWASNDGCFECGVYGGETVDLYQWAVDNNLELKPLEEDYDYESEFQEDMTAWEDEIMHGYLTNLAAR